MYSPPKPLGMPTKSWGIIYCPKEGSPRTHKRWNKIRRYLEEQGVAFDFVQSEGAGAVERLAAMMTRTGYGTIIVVGGDAALGHALCGIMQTASPTGGHPALGVIPNGFGNDFAKYWGFSTDDYRATIQSLILRRVRRVDVGVVKAAAADGNKTFYFLNCINLGIAASITNLRRRTGSLLRGYVRTLSYLLSALLLLFQRSRFKFAFTLNGERVERYAMNICVSSAHGYGMTPSAVPYNGQLDAVLVSKPQLFQLFHGLWLLFTGRFLAHRGGSIWRTRHIHFEQTHNAPLSIDGRVIHEATSELDVTILPEEIEFLITAAR